MPVALTIAGSDSGGGAGIQADIKTFLAHDVYGVCAITAVTAQNTRGVVAADTLSPSLVRAQIEAVAADFDIRAAKTGMLGRADVVREVARAVADLRIPNLVVDPVMLAKSGDSLLDVDALDALRTALFPLAIVVTPNIPEAEALAGVRITSPQQAVAAARRILEMGARAVIVKGGHATSADIEDVLCTRTDVRVFTHARVPGSSTHGTGCTFAAGLAAHLARGLSLADAVPLVQHYIAGAIAHAPGLGDGHGPMAHDWNLTRSS